MAKWQVRPKRVCLEKNGTGRDENSRRCGLKNQIYPTKKLGWDGESQHDTAFFNLKSQKFM